MTRKHLPAVAVRASLVAALACAGCASVPAGRSAVDSVHVVGAKELDEGDVSDKLATTASPKFLGLFRGVVYDYAVFDASALQRDLARVERYYRGHGFLEAHARTARVIPSGAEHVRVEIVVEEGPPTTNRRVRIDGLDALPAPIADAARAAANDALPEGARFDEERLQERASRAGAHAHRSRLCVCEGRRRRSGRPARARGRLHVHGAPRARGGLRHRHDRRAPRRRGHSRRSTRPLRRAIHIREGTPYSTAEIDSATQALLDLKVFSSAQIVPKLPEPPATVVPLPWRSSRRSCAPCSSGAAWSSTRSRPSCTPSPAGKTATSSATCATSASTSSPAWSSTRRRVNNFVVADPVSSGGAPPGAVPPARVHRGAHVALRSARAQRLPAARRRRARTPTQTSSGLRRAARGRSASTGASGVTSSRSSATTCRASSPSRTRGASTRPCRASCSRSRSSPRRSTSATDASSRTRGSTSRTTCRLRASGAARRTCASSRT